MTTIDFIIRFLDSSKIQRNYINANLRTFSQENGVYVYSLYGAIIAAYLCYMNYKKYKVYSYWQEDAFIAKTKRFVKKLPPEVSRWATRGLSNYEEYLFSNFVEQISLTNLTLKQISQLMKVDFSC